MEFCLHGNAHHLKMIISKLYQMHPLQGDAIEMILVMLQALEIMTEQQTEDPTALPIFYNAEDNQFYEL